MFQLGIAERKTVANVIVDVVIPKMMLDIFTEPDTVTCILCRATVSIRKGDKARFFNHISLDHEVHYDMDLFFVVSFLNSDQKNTVIDIINEKLVRNNEEGNVVINNEDGQHNDPLDDDAKNEKILNKNDHSVEQSEGSLVSVKEELQIRKENSDDPYEKVKCKDKDCEMLVPKKAMNIHIKVKHINKEKKKVKSIKKKVKMVACNFCEKSMRRSSLPKHMRMTHKIGKEQQQKLRVNVNVLTMSNEENSQSDQSLIINTKNIKEEAFDSSLTESGKNSNKTIDEIQADKTKISEKNDETLFRKCKLCLKSLKKSNYTRHLRETHSGKPIRKCPLCSYGFSREAHFYLHLDNVHKDKDLHFLDDKKNPKFSYEDCKVQCRGCNEKFISEVSMMYHSIKIHGHGTHQCVKCKKRFPSKHNSEKHIRLCSKKVVLPLF